MTHGALGHAELLGRAGEALVSRCSFEGLEGVKSRQARHGFHFMRKLFASHTQSSGKRQTSAQLGLYQGAVILFVPDCLHHLLIKKLHPDAPIWASVA
jgi:hypothetical protein